MLKLIADSTCNLSAETLARYDIRVAPIAIQFREESYEEGLTIDRDLFYSKIEALGIIPTTSQPTPAWFARFYREVAAQGHQVLVITITSKHSGTYQSAVMAKEMAPEADVEVFDSATISLGTGWMLLEAARAAEAGQTRQAILARLEAIRNSCHLYLTPATLKYLQMSGRVGKLQGALASLLNVKPIIVVRDGMLEAMGSVRTRARALARVVDLIAQKLGSTAPVNLAVIQARSPEDGAWLETHARARLNCREMLTADLVASLAVHGGPGVVGLFGYPA